MRLLSCKDLEDVLLSHWETEAEDNSPAVFGYMRSVLLQNDVLTVEGLEEEHWDGQMHPLDHTSVATTPSPDQCWSVVSCAVPDPPFGAIALSASPLPLLYASFVDLLLKLPSAVGHFLRQAPIEFEGLWEVFECPELARLTGAERLGTARPDQ